MPYMYIGSQLVQVTQEQYDSAAAKAIEAKRLAKLDKTKREYSVRCQFHATSVTLLVKALTVADAASMAKRMPGGKGAKYYAVALDGVEQGQVEGEAPVEPPPTRPSIPLNSMTKSMQRRFEASIDAKTFATQFDRALATKVTLEAKPPERRVIRALPPIEHTRYLPSWESWDRFITARTGLLPVTERGPVAVLCIACGMPVPLTETAVVTIGCIIKVKYKSPKWERIDGHWVEISEKVMPMSHKGHGCEDCQNLMFAANKATALENEARERAWMAVADVNKPSKGPSKRTAWIEVDPRSIDMARESVKAYYQADARR